MLWHNTKFDTYIDLVGIKIQIRTNHFHLGFFVSLLQTFSCRRNPGSCFFANCKCEERFWLDEISICDAISFSNYSANLKWIFSSLSD